MSTLAQAGVETASGIRKDSALHKLLLDVEQPLEPVLAGEILPVLGLIQKYLQELSKHS